MAKNSDSYQWEQSGTSAETWQRRWNRIRTNRIPLRPAKHTAKYIYMNQSERASWARIQSKIQIADQLERKIAIDLQWKVVEVGEGRESGWEEEIGRGEKASTWFQFHGSPYLHLRFGVRVRSRRPRSTRRSEPWIQQWRSRRDSLSPSGERSGVSLGLFIITVWLWRLRAGWELEHSSTVLRFSCHRISCTERRSDLLIRDI